MVRITRERIDDLLALAEIEATVHAGEFADRYVRLARRVGMRYNVRLLPEYVELYCRGCSTFWVEGRTVRTRVRPGRRVRQCLHCGRIRRVPLGGRARSGGENAWGTPRAVPLDEGALLPQDAVTAPLRPEPSEREED